MGERMSETTKQESSLDELVTGKTTEEIVGADGLLKQLTKVLIERAINAEMNHHLGYEEHAGTTLRGGPDHFACSVLFEVFAQLPRSGGDDGGAGALGGSRHHLALRPAPCTLAESASPRPGASK